MNLQPFRFLCSALCAALLLPALLSAQADNPLNFTDVVKRVGFEVGFTSAWQSGEYQTGCGVFQQGANLNFLIAAAYDQEISRSFKFEAIAGYQSKNIKSSYISEENIGISTESGPVNAKVSFDNIGRANFSYFFVQPSLKFYPFSNLYAGIGPSINLLLGSNTQYQKDILSRTIQLNELGLSEVYYSESETSDPYSKVFPAETGENASGVTLDLVMMIGAEFNVGKTYTNPINSKAKKKIAIGPRIQYAIPLLSAMSDGQHDLRLNGLQFLVGGRFSLN